VQNLKGLGVRLIVVDTQLAGIPLLRTYVKTQDQYEEITLGDNIVLSVAESRAFLARIGIQGEIISTPGHSDDSVTLILDDGSAFTGDLTVPQAARSDAMDLVRASWEHIRTKGGRTIYPGHGPVGTL
jgi:glyoxylase-like metal-dependent hydrolase (beta-lactamase superfamily II)